MWRRPHLNRRSFFESCLYCTTDGCPGCFNIAEDSAPPAPPNTPEPKDERVCNGCGNAGWNNLGEFCNCDYDQWCENRRECDLQLSQGPIDNGPDGYEHNMALRDWKQRNALDTMKEDGENEFSGMKSADKPKAEELSICWDCGRPCVVVGDYQRCDCEGVQSRSRHGSLVTERDDDSSTLVDNGEWLVYPDHDPLNEDVFDSQTTDTSANSGPIADRPALPRRPSPTLSLDLFCEDCGDGGWLIAERKFCSCNWGIQCEKMNREWRAFNEYGGDASDSTPDEPACTNRADSGWVNIHDQYYSCDCEGTSREHDLIVGMMPGYDRAAAGDVFAQANAIAVIGQAQSVAANTTTASTPLMNPTATPCVPGPSTPSHSGSSMRNSSGTSQGSQPQAKSSTSPYAVAPISTSGPLTPDSSAFSPRSPETFQESPLIADSSSTHISTPSRTRNANSSSDLEWAAAAMSTETPFELLSAQVRTRGHSDLTQRYTGDELDGVTETLTAQPRRKSLDDRENHGCNEE